ncbi:MAG: hypothetical protein RLZ53_1240 [Actinomycetota bacterium]|jgi:hypothetical protein
MTTTPRKPAAAKPAPAAKTPVRKPAVAAKPAAAPEVKEAPVYDFTKPYKMLTGIDDSAFCDKVSAHLNAGYKLVGGAAVTTKGANVIVAQAVTKESNIAKPKAKAKAKKKK